MPAGGGQGNWVQAGGGRGEWVLADARRFIWYNWLMLLELDGSNAPIRKYAWGLDLAGLAGGSAAGGVSFEAAGGIGGLVGVLDAASGARYACFYDANGNVGQLVDQSDGSLAATYEYDAYGNVVARSGSYAAANPFRFSTKYWDDETGFGYWGYRYYSSRPGRWLNRDPVNELGAVTVRYAVHPTSATGAFLPRDPEHVQEIAGSHLYAYVYNDPPNHFDPLGLQAKKACTLKPPLEHDCCLCLLYSEAGGEPGCLEAYAWVMLNRQRTNWNDFRRERSFCQQAATGPASGGVAWAGGEGSKRYESCCVCLNNATNPDCEDCCPLSDAEAEAALRASDVCARVRRAEGQDPADGAQYVGTKGAVTNAVGAHNIPNPCRLFQIPGCSSWFAKCSRRPLGR